MEAHSQCASYEAVSSMTSATIAADDVKLTRILFLSSKAGITMHLLIFRVWPHVRQHTDTVCLTTSRMSSSSYTSYRAWVSSLDAPSAAAQHTLSNAKHYTIVITTHPQFKKKKMSTVFSFPPSSALSISVSPILFFRLLLFTIE